MTSSYDDTGNLHFGFFNELKQRLSFMKCNIPPVTRSTLQHPNYLKIHEEENEVVSDFFFSLFSVFDIVILTHEVTEWTALLLKL